MINVIYWDLGGVCVADNVEPVFEEFGIGYRDQQKEAWARHRVGEINQQQFFEQALAGTGLEGKIEEIKQRAKEMIVLKKNGAVPIIKDLFAQGKYRQGILSNHSLVWSDYILQDLGIGQLVNRELILISEAEKMAKPDHIFFHRAQQRAGVPHSDILFFDNQSRNIYAARATGMKAELFTNSTEAIQQLASYGINLRYRHNLF